VIRFQGYRFSLKPTQGEAVLLGRFLGCSRFVWNELLAQNKLRYQRGEKRLGYKAMCEYLVFLKNERPFLREVHSQPLQQTLKDLDAAYRRALDPALPARFPRFKKRGRRQGIRFPQGFAINGAGVFLPKIGWIGFRRSRHIEGRPTSVTISCDCHGWFLSIQTEREVPVPRHASNSAIGIDLGVARFAALSDGTSVDASNAFEKHRKRLAFLQRRLSRKRKFSANWRKAKARVSRFARTIANIRNDMLHKASTTISKNHAVVVMEDLCITNMTASAKGTPEASGANVRAKSGLNRRISDQGWGEFRRQLGYKLAWAGGELVLVDARNTSRTCTQCGCVSRENRQTQAVFLCTACRHTANADTNAAINILRRAGQVQIACGDSPLGESLKQEAHRVA
jgi:putative transposase